MLKKLVFQLVPHQQERFPAESKASLKSAQALHEISGLWPSRLGPYIWKIRVSGIVWHMATW